MTKRIRNFLYGMGGVLDLLPADDVETEIARLRQARDDRAALERDWRAVGSDMRKAMRRFEDARNVRHD